VNPRGQVKNDSEEHMNSINKNAAAVVSVSLVLLLFAFLSRPRSASTIAATNSFPTAKTGLPLDSILEDNFENYTAWAEGSTHGDWFVNFNGLGMVGLVSDPTSATPNTVLFQKPKASMKADETHASLVTSGAVMTDFNVSVKVKTVQQLRTPTPNAWETAWVIWRFTDNDHFYYFTLKTNGWELGKRDPAYPGGQRFLQTGALPKVILGTFATVNVQQVGATMTVSVNGAKVTSFTDSERPYPSGKIGLYNEDALVYFDDISSTYK